MAINVKSKNYEFYLNLLKNYKKCQECEKEKRELFKKYNLTRGNYHYYINNLRKAGHIV